MLQHFKTLSLNALLPPVCLNCHAPLLNSNQICPACWQNLHFISHPFCQIMGTPLPFHLGEMAVSAQAQAEPPVYDQARSIALYEGTMRSLIHKFKYQDRHELVQLFASWLALTGSDLIGKSDMIVPIPLHHRRLWQRRFNQSALLAKRLGQITGSCVNYSYLKRHKKTRPQVGLTSHQRRDNLQGAFMIEPKAVQHIRNRSILLIDDVITTGTTANAAARVLKQGGAEAVYILSLGIVINVPSI